MNLAAGLLGVVGGTAKSVAKRAEKDEDALRQANLERIRNKFKTSERVAGEEAATARVDVQIAAQDKRQAATIAGQEERHLESVAVQREAEAGRAARHESGLLSAERVASTKATTAQKIKGEDTRTRDIKTLTKAINKTKVDIGAATDAGDEEKMVALQLVLGDQTAQRDLLRVPKSSGRFSHLYTK